jgi:hypothetical protein
MRLLVALLVWLLRGVFAAQGAVLATGFLRLMIIQDF